MLHLPFLFFTLKCTNDTNVHNTQQADAAWSLTCFWDCCNCCWLSFCSWIRLLLRDPIFHENKEQNPSQHRLYRNNCHFLSFMGTHQFLLFLHTSRHLLKYIYTSIRKKIDANIVLQTRSSTTTYQSREGVRESFCVVCVNLIIPSHRVDLPMALAGEFWGGGYKSSFNKQWFPYLALQGSTCVNVCVRRAKQLKMN